MLECTLQSISTLSNVDDEVFARRDPRCGKLSPDAASTRWVLKERAIRPGILFQKANYYQTIFSYMNRNKPFGVDGEASETVL